MKTKGLERSGLIVLTGDGFNHAWTTAKASAPSALWNQDKIITAKEYAPLGTKALILVEPSKGNNPKKTLTFGPFPKVALTPHPFWTPLW